jgi:hypothetical protein
LGKYKAVKKKSDTAVPQVKPGVPCLILVFGVMVAVVVIMFLVIKSA